MDCLSSQVIPKPARSRKEQMGMDLGREEGSFWQGSYKGMLLSVCTELGTGARRRESSRTCCLIAMETAKELAGQAEKCLLLGTTFGRCDVSLQR